MWNASLSTWDQVSHANTTFSSKRHRRSIGDHSLIVGNRKMNCQLELKFCWEITLNKWYSSWSITRNHQVYLHQPYQHHCTHDANFCILASASRNPQLMECITSWLREVPVLNIINSPLLDHIFAGVTDDDCGQEAAECLVTLLRETMDVDDSPDAIHALFPRVLALRTNIEKVAEEEDTEKLKALTKVISTAGQCWVVAIARQPAHFRPLVEAALECAARDKEHDVIEHTFLLWYDLKQYLVLERYIEGRMELMDIFSKLVDILLKQLQYPHPESGNENDLFDGDREQEEKFREFRHQMGDTLKDCCDVMGVTECLTKVLHAIQLWMQNHAGHVTDSNVPNWQQLEAPLFAMRALGRMVDKEENIVLPQLMPLLVQMPSHEKLRFATIMVLGRYTEWTAAHPEYLEPQFSYIVNSFETDSREIMRAAALSMKFFCTDCKNLLSGQVLQLQTFYDQILDKLPDLSKEEISEGVANVVAVQPVSETYRLLKTYCDPLVQRLMTKANHATDEEGKLALAGTVLHSSTTRAFCCMENSGTTN